MSYTKDTKLLPQEGIGIRKGIACSANRLEQLTCYIVTVLQGAILVTINGRIDD